MLPGPVRVGLDVGGSTVEGVALGPRDEVLATCRRRTTPGVDGVVESAAGAVAELVDRTGGPPEHVGVGVPGLVDPLAGTVRSAVNLRLGPDPVALADRLGTALGGVPVTLENDVKAVTWGAWNLLAPDGDLALLSLGTGVAAGLVVGGVLQRGTASAAGEVGHLSVDPAGQRCGCGQRGCLETVAAGSALRRAWPHGEPGREAGHLFAAAAAGDPAAVRVADSWAAGVALAVRTLVLTVDPALVVLAGGVTQVGPPVLHAVGRALDRQAGDSEFLRGLRTAQRLVLLPADRPVAAIGAATGTVGPWIRPSIGPSIRPGASARSR
ncbi:ROK family protein [Kineococcus sp. NPDC059986]|uniref:ROK family protein n=1 Tax=Kineococcus sp. NPDC059986 TaxID=3155538 RepID=UPI00344EAE4F